MLKYIQDFQNKGREETGTGWNLNETNQSLFKMMLKRCMPVAEHVVGLNTLPWETFQAHLVHHVEQHRKKKKEARDATEALVTHLYKTQLGELTKAQKEKEKAGKLQPSIQAPTMEAAVIVPAVPNLPQTVQAYVPAPQVPMQHPVQLQTYMQQSGPAPMPMPLIHVHLSNQQGPPQCRPMRGQGQRQGPGKWQKWPQAPQQGQRPPAGPQREGNAPKTQSFECWGCGEKGHIRRNCQVCPWENRPRQQEQRSQHRGPPGPNQWHEQAGPWIGLTANWS